MGGPGMELEKGAGCKYGLQAGKINGGEALHSNPSGTRRGIQSHTRH